MHQVAYKDLLVMNHRLFGQEASGLSPELGTGLSIVD